MTGRDEQVEAAARVLWDAVEADINDNEDSRGAGYIDVSRALIDASYIDMGSVARALADAGLLADPGEVKRLRAEWDEARHRMDLMSGGLRIANDRAGKAEIENAELRARLALVEELADKWCQDFRLTTGLNWSGPWYANDLRTALAPTDDTNQQVET